MSRIRCPKCSKSNIELTGEFTIIAKGEVVNGEPMWKLSGLLSEEPFGLVGAQCRDCSHIWNPKALKIDINF